VAAIVSNLPLDRAIAMGGGGGEGKWGGDGAADYAPLLAALRDQAPRHAYISGRTLNPKP
jgi:hypothetical protein